MIDFISVLLTDNEVKLSYICTRNGVREPNALSEYSTSKQGVSTHII